MLPRLVNLALLGLFPLAWMAPLAHAEVMWFWGADEVSIISGVRQLYEKDLFLCIIVVVFAMVAPYMKTVALAYAQFSDNEAGRRMMQRNRSFS
ncbi:MAG: paraquat-inducible protein A [Pseudomonadota bacterium]